MTPRLQRNGMQARCADRLLLDASLLDLSIELIDVVDSNAAHERAVFGNELGKGKELHVHFAAAQDADSSALTAALNWML